MWIATAYNNDNSKKEVRHIWQISAEPIAKSDEEFLFFCAAGLWLSLNPVTSGLFLFFFAIFEGTIAKMFPWNCSLGTEKWKLLRFLGSCRMALLGNKAFRLRYQFDEKFECYIGNLTQSNWLSEIYIRLALLRTCIFVLNRRGEIYNTILSCISGIKIFLNPAS